MAARLLAILEMDVFLYLGRGQEVLITEASNSFVNLQRPLDFSFRSKTNQMDGVHWTEIIVFGSVTRRPVLSESFFCFVSRVLRLLLSSFSVHNFNYFPSEKKKKKEGEPWICKQIRKRNRIESKRYSERKLFQCQVWCSTVSLVLYDNGTPCRLWSLWQRRNYEAFRVTAIPLRKSDLFGAG